MVIVLSNGSDHCGVDCKSGWRESGREMAVNEKIITLTKQYIELQKKCDNRG